MLREINRFSIKLFCERHHPCGSYRRVFDRLGLDCRRSGAKYV